MRLTLTKQNTDAVVGLDIEAGSIAATQVEVNGSVRVSASAIGSLDPGAFHEGEILDAERLSAALKALFSEHRLSKRVRLGIGNQRVVVRTVRLPAIENPKEMEAAVRFQAQEQIPMPLDQAVLEHRVVGGVPAEEGSTPQVDVVVVAARRDMVSSFIEPIRRAGLHPVGVDLSAFAMIRALAGTADAAATAEQPGGPAAEGAVGSEGVAGAEGAARPGERPAGAVLYCSLGDVTNLAVARGRTCLFTRVSHVGLEAISAGLAASSGLESDHAAQWLAHVGLETPVEEIEGDPETVAAVRRTLEEGVTSLADELRLSLDYYGAQEGALPVRAIVLCGPGSSISGLAQRMEVGLARDRRFAPHRAGGLRP